VLFPAWGADGVPLAGAIATLLPLAVLPAVSLLTRVPEAALVARAFGEAALATAPAASDAAASDGRRAAG
jgi:hypothetical protein